MSAVCKSSVKGGISLGESWKEWGLSSSESRSLAVPTTQVIWLKNLHSNFRYGADLVAEWDSNGGCGRS